tara:strand:+ start:2498 stop:2686 length:189 start_codon:yes stop_codon:yes gene_type:complete
MIRRHQGKIMKNLLKIDKSDFKSDEEFYTFLWKKKYNVEFNKTDSLSIKSQLKTMIKKFDKK